MTGVGKTDADNLLARILTPLMSFMKHLWPSKAEVTNKFAR